MAVLCAAAECRVPGKKESTAVKLKAVPTWVGLPNKGHYAIQAGTFKVTDFDTNWKPICDFLLVINTNLHPISCRFEVIADYSSDLGFRQGVPVFNTFVQG